MHFKPEIWPWVLHLYQIGPVHLRDAWHGGPDWPKAAPDHPSAVSHIPVALRIRGDPSPLAPAGARQCDRTSDIGLDITAVA